MTAARADEVSIAVTGDEQLIRRAQSGEASAFELLTERYYAECLRFAQHQLGNREDAEEAVQDALLRAYRAVCRGQRPESYRAWLLRIVVNCCRTVVAKRIRRRRLFDAWWSREEPDTPRFAAPREPSDELEPKLRAALDALTPPLREAFLLRHVEELSYEEMSAVTGAGVSALKMRVKRAAELLLESLTEAP